MTTVPPETPKHLPIDMAPSFDVLPWLVGVIASAAVVALAIVVWSL